jgi:GNAT superfamily N-acetyltransferase
LLRRRSAAEAVMTRERAIAWLESDPLRHVVTLKMLASFGEQMELRLREGDDGWALAALLPTSAFEYDARHYADVPLAVLLNGSSAALQLALLAELRGGFVLKLSGDIGDDAVRRFVRERLGALPVRSFTSFTAAPGLVLDVSNAVVGSALLDAPARELFRQTIYDESELGRYFADGAHWFGLRQGSRLVSGCFVFRNFGAVWEVAGVFTEPAQRRHGLAAEAVRAAVTHLLARGLRPRYQVESSNQPSVALAQRLGLSEFIRVEHFVVRP